jgi:UDP-glucose 4-epimerase
MYGNPAEVPITVACSKGRCFDPYGHTKSIPEEILIDMHMADVKMGESQPWNLVILRYINPGGVHVSGLIGENPNGIPNNLFLYIT